MVVAAEALYQIGDKKRLFLQLAQVREVVGGRLVLDLEVSIIDILFVLRILIVTISTIFLNLNRSSNTFLLFLHRLSIRHLPLVHKAFKNFLWCDLVEVNTFISITVFEFLV